MDTLTSPGSPDFLPPSPPEILRVASAPAQHPGGGGETARPGEPSCQAIDGVIDELTLHLEAATAAMACSGAELRVLEDELNQALRELARTQELLALRMDLDRLLAQPGGSASCLLELQQLLVTRLGDWCAIDRRTAGGALCRSVLHRDPRLKLQSTRLAVAATGRDPLWRAAHVARDGRPRFYAEVSIDELSPGVAAEQQHLLIELGLRSLLIVPLEARGLRLGAMTLAGGWGRPAFTRELLDFMQGVAAAVALALLVPEAQRNAATVLSPNAPSILPGS